MSKYLIALVFALNGCLSSELSPVWQGNWVVTSEVASAPVSGLDDEQIALLMGSTLLISQDKIEFLGQSCSKKREEVEASSINAFLASYKLDPELNFPSKTFASYFECQGDLPIRDFLVSDSSIWFVWYGVLFKAEKVHTSPSQ